MANVRLSSQDRKELDKFTKFLSLKTVQVIVQSRLGEKLKTKSKPFSSGVDWFSVTVDDLPEVMQETRKALSGRLPTFNLSLCVEISLKTVEGDTMVLETWSLGMTDRIDADVRVTYTVYNRMGILLKSLIAVTRVTPAYRLSCRQGPESYVICYRIYLGEPQLHALGDGYEKVCVGQVSTPVGTFCLAVSYRTKLTITPQRVERDCPFMVKSDHFKPDLSPNRLPKVWPHAESRSTCVDELAAACLECQELGCMPFPMHSPQECNGVHHQHCSPQVEKSLSEGEAKFAGGDFMSLSEPKKVGAFVGECKMMDPNAISEYLIPDTAFASLLQHDHVNNVIGKHASQNTKKTNNNNNPDTNGVDHNGDNLDTHSEHGSQDSQKSNSSITSGAMDDFVMVELKTPFASPDPNGDLSAFYRECQTAPLLDSFKNHPNLAEQVNDIAGQLATFELNMHEFDDLVESLCNSETWK